MSVATPPALVDDAAMDFLRAILGRDVTVTPVAGDASFRRYFRAESPAGRFIFMDAPPDKEDSTPFLDIARFLHPHGVRVPQVVEARVASGHILLEDFGDVTFLKALEAGTPPETLYQPAVETLLAMQATPRDGSCIAHDRPFDHAMLSRELALFTDWYVEGILATPIPPADRQAFLAAFGTLLDGILTQPWTFVHRDYHSRNLMWHEERVGVLDFQDAVMGPVTYDLASLLRDCYVAWDAPFRDQVMDWWFADERIRRIYPVSREQLQKDFDWMSIQRNLKAVGIFGRLSRRDGKHGYLNDIPRTMGYIRENLAKYPELTPLRGLIDRFAPTGEPR
ncbi:MAG: phosphotransferase [Magnetococcales bacterium]|nr:phosphotransferase [Magnetococcales bacterium]